MSLTKFCNAAGCHNIIPITERYCADHLHVPVEREAERQKRYDDTVRHTRDAALNTFYLSKEWEAKRAYIIRLYKGIDIYAYYIKHSIETATMVHHIKPLRADWALRLLDTNLIPLSAKSHGEIEKLYKSGKRVETQQLLLSLIERWKHDMMG